jgi:hypothetical protein
MYPIHLNFLRHSTSSNENKYVIEVDRTLETKNYCGGISSIDCCLIKDGVTGREELLRDHYWSSLEDTTHYKPW